jgi:dipeptide transport system permease protein
VAAYVLRRLLLAIPTLLGVVVIVFVILRVVPGDPITMMIGPGATEADIQRLREIYGLDRSILDQFVLYLGDLAHGDFGTSISLRQDVMELILRRLPVTLELCVAAIATAVTLGIAFALAGAYWRGRWPETIVEGFSGLGLAIPDFLWGLMFILILGVLVPVLPISGRIDPRLDVEWTTQFYLIESLVRGEFDVFWSLVRHIVLPALALALPLMAIGARVLKASINEAMTQDYVMLARVKGMGRWRIIVGEALRNALIPTITLTGVQFTFLVGGTVLIERIFSYPGLGNMAVGAVIDRDLPLIQGIVFTFAVIFIALNLLIDLSYALLNPRISHGR